jgi:hypothetical protein
MIRIRYELLYLRVRAGSSLVAYYAVVEESRQQVSVLIAVDIMDW